MYHLIFNLGYTELKTGRASRGVRSIVLSLSVCLSVCLSAHITCKPQSRSSHMFTVAMARSSSEGFIRYVLFVLWMTLCFYSISQWANGQESSTTLYFSEIRHVATPVGRQTTIAFGRIHQHAARGGQSLLPIISLLCLPFGEKISKIIYTCCRNCRSSWRGGCAERGAGSEDERQCQAGLRTARQVSHVSVGWQRRPRSGARLWPLTNHRQDRTRDSCLRGLGTGLCACAIVWMVSSLLKTISRVLSVVLLRNKMITLMM